MPKRFLTRMATGVALGGVALLLGSPATAYAQPPDGADSSEYEKYQHEEPSENGSEADSKDHEKKHYEKKKHKKHDKKDGKDGEALEIVCSNAIVQGNEAEQANLGGDAIAKADKDGIAVAVNVPIQTQVSVGVNVGEVIAGFVVECLAKELNEEIANDLAADLAVDEVDSLGDLGNMLVRMDEQYADSNGPESDNAAGNAHAEEALEALASSEVGEALQDAGVHLDSDGIYVGFGPEEVPNGPVAAGDGGALSSTHTTGMAAAGAGMLGVAALGGLGLLRRRSTHGSVA